MSREFNRDNRKRTSQDDEQMIYGIHPVLEALNAGKEFERVFIHHGARGDGIQQVRRMLREKQIAFQEVPVEKLNRLTLKNHQDIIAFISPISYQPLEEVVTRVFEQGMTPLVLLLDRITDVRNFGAIARTAECAGVHALVIPKRGAAAVSADAIRTSAGALHNLPVCRVDHLRDAVHLLKECGLKVFAASEKGKTFHFNADFSQPAAIIMGSEEDGVSSDLLKVCDQWLRIPMTGKVSSLNVSVAAGVLIFEALRQRMSGAGESV